MVASAGECKPTLPMLCRRWIPEISGQPGWWGGDGKDATLKTILQQPLASVWRPETSMLSYCCCPQQLFLSVLGARIYGWLLLWQPGDGNLPGGGRNQKQACPSFFSSQGKRAVAFSDHMLSTQPCSCSGHSAETLLCCGFCSTLP